MFDKFFFLPSLPYSGHLSFEVAEYMGIHLHIPGSLDQVIHFPRDNSIIYFGLIHFPGGIKLVFKPYYTGESLHNLNRANQ